jgi:hypothetical protein
LRYWYSAGMIANLEKKRLCGGAIVFVFATNNPLQGEAYLRKTCFCETNSPVKWRYMNALEKRGLEFGKAVCGGSAFAAAAADKENRETCGCRRRQRRLVGLGSCETNRIYLNGKTQGNILWSNAMERRNVKIAIRFIFSLSSNFEGSGTQAKACGYGWKSDARRGVSLEASNRQNDSEIFESKRLVRSVPLVNEEITL